MSSLYTERLTQHLQRVEAALPTYLPKEGTLQDTVVRAMSYACEGGGKRLRPVLTLEFCHLCGKNPEIALPFAAAIEMIHSYSLVHDDMPCMDDSPLRRGKPSVHTAYGEAMALLAGDALLNRAFETVLDTRYLQDVPPEAALRAAWILAHRAGIGGMIGGQVIDLESEGKQIDADTLKTLQEGKTAALIQAACEMGCLVGGGSHEQVEAATQFGYYLGLAFQIIDDILDVTSTAEQLGKPVGGDADHDKNTYVSLLGLDKAHALAEDYTAKAIAALSVFDEQRADLTALAQTLLKRIF
ncbi:MAG: polyprenyl synthetase family protein [Clostridia bacterium]|nr:polyprenyl synthetase family protein [Clostridia bacterium]